MIINERTKRILEAISPKTNDKILVIGTGVYPNIEEILFKKFNCKNVISGDINQNNLNNAKKILPELNFLYLNAQKKLSFDKEMFDKIILTEVLEHLRNENIAIREINRILKNNGKLILSVPKRRWFKIFNPVTILQHKREYSEQSIINLLKSEGFEIGDIFVGGNFYETIDLYIHLIYKYLLGKLHLGSFFENRVNSGYKKGFKGKGTDIIVVTRKR